MKYLVIISLILAICATGAYSISCYVCTNAAGNKGCGHGADVDGKYLIDCNGPQNSGNPPLPGGGNYTVCRKMVTKVDFDVNENKATEGDGIIKRSCGFDEEKYVGECYYRGGLGGRIDVCTCKENKCNGSNTLKNGIYISLVSSVLVLVQALRS